MTVDVHVSGYCVADASIVDRARKREKIKFYAVWLHIFHERFGHILVDTGYSKLFYEATRTFPEKLYAWATPVFISDSESAVSVLRSKNIDPSDISYIIISHFHADHICALRDFPSAKFVCSRAALDEVNRVQGWRAVRKGILKALLPADFHQRVLLVEDIAASSGIIDGGLEAKSFFDESRIQFVYLQGHATGMLGLLISTADKTILYAADAQWDKDVFEAGRLPAPIVKLFFSSWADFISSADKLRAYMALNPATRLMFTHCRQTLKYVR
jgi:glyoxylase-like metal-dependent hydrolase (beta-lactamase superfamily II)